MHQDDYDRWIAPAQARMVNCVWRIVRNAADTEDVMQEVLLQVLKRFDAVRGHPNPTALLLRMCANKSLDHLRRRKARLESADPPPPETASAAPGPRQELAEAEQRRQLLAFIARLPAREAEAITLHAIEEMEYPAVAAAMGCRETTVRVLVGRARERFRTAFGGRTFSDSAADSLSSLQPSPD